MLVASTSCLFKYCFYRSLRIIRYLYIVLMCFDELSERKKWEVIVTRAGDDVGRHTRTKEAWFILQLRGYQIQNSQTEEGSIN